MHGEGHCSGFGGNSLGAVLPPSTVPRVLMGRYVVNSFGVKYMPGVKLF